MITNKIIDALDKELGADKTEQQDDEILADDYKDGKKHEFNNDVKNAQKIKQEIEDIKNEIKDTKKQYTTILGIFASIVIGFSGAISFSSKTIEALNYANIHHLIIITLILGVVIGGIFFFLCYCLLELNDINKKGLNKIGIACLILILILSIVSFSVLPYKDDKISDNNSTFKK